MCSRQEVVFVDYTRNALSYVLVMARCLITLLKGLTKVHVQQFLTCTNNSTKTLLNLYISPPAEQLCPQHVNCFQGHFGLAKKNY